MLYPLPPPQTLFPNRSPVYSFCIRSDILVRREHWTGRHKCMVAMVIIVFQEKFEQACHILFLSVYQTQNIEILFRQKGRTDKN